MTKIAAAIGEDEITSTEGETLANILVIQKSIVETADLERRVDELERRMPARENPGTGGIS